MSIMAEELTNPPQIYSRLAEEGGHVHPDARFTPEQLQAYLQEAQIPEGSMLVHRTQGGTQQAQGTQAQEGGAQDEQGTGEQSQAQSTPEVVQSTHERIGVESTLAELREATRKAPKQWRNLRQQRGDSAASASKPRVSDAFER
jgi:hypothetical protein